MLFGPAHFCHTYDEFQTMDEMKALLRERDLLDGQIEMERAVLKAVRENE